MPYIQMNISKKIDDGKREAIRASIGKHVSVLPGKSEAVTMLRIEDDTKMYLGSKVSDCVFMSVKLYMTAPMALKGEFARAVIKDLDSIAGINKDNIYICFEEYSSWVSKGDIK